MSPPTSSSSSSDVLLKNKFLGYLIWQSIPSSLIFFFFSLTTSSFHQTLFSSLFISFLTFHFSNLIFSFSLSFISSPYPHRLPSPFAFASPFLRFLFLPSALPPSPEFRLRAKASLCFVFFVVASGLSAAVSMCGLIGIGGFEDGWVWVWVFGRVGLRGFFVGLMFGLHYVFMRRWILHFPIIQRPPYFNFKMGIPSASRRAFQLSAVAFLFSAILLAILPHPLGGSIATRGFFTEQILFSIGTFAIFLCWEVTHHLHLVLHTKRSVLAPPKGSAAAETNPSEHLLSALEESNPTSLLRYLAYLDLCMVSENNVDTWRRAAFFEETGETYKRVIAVCLRPLEHLASTLGEGLGNSVDKPAQLSNQLSSPTDAQLDSKYLEPLDNFQLYAWCSRTVASLTACSRKEDKFGVAQLSGSNAAVISTLLSCLLAVENFMGKKTNLQSPNQLLGPAGIRWATVNSGRVDIAASKRRNGPMNSKAYAIADVLKTSIYQVVSAFHDEMLAGAKASLLDKDWITSDKPLFGTREMLIQKLRIFLDFRAT
ncbi:hypothetical protein Lal_00038551 [Lupinus albus]|uniref:Putative nucleoporin protein Ndc1-Nup n=1 Tax=Lupinus albus TaxID=3870 RepID=A0A6A5NC36_LUPAL|nr:putative nucleoporin protein Ndc1-Nup [Lupinus albus]KAF1881908.1 hypothetical protein Lal_00038551 [Lupinus albus]